MLRPTLPLILSAALAAPTIAGSLEEQWRDDVFPLVERYCFDCHGEGIREGGLDLEDYPGLADMQADRQTWKTIRGHLDQNLMPPLDEDQPARDDRRRIVEWIDAAVFPVDPDNPDPGRVTLRRLNRIEYQNTLRDLLGVSVEVSELLPPDDTGYGFDNIGDVLTLSPAHLERFLEAARVALDATVHPEPMPFPEKVIPGDELSGPGNRIDRQQLLSSNGEAATEFEVPAPGKYEITVVAGGTKGGDQDPELDLRLDGVSLGTWSISESYDSPGARRIETRFESAGPRRLAAAFTNDHYDESHPDPNLRDRNLLIREIRIRGPLGGARPEKPESHRRIYFPRKDGQSDDEWALAVLREFAGRAFRRPPLEGEVERYLHFVRLTRDQGQDVEHGIRLALEAMLVSPAFLYREEPQPEPDNADRIVEIEEFTLASRLSYFLWSTMPDEELLRLAGEGRLREQLDAQVDRMLDSPKSAEFVRNFAGQWLQLRDLDSVRPARNTFPSFDLALRKDMRRETEMLISHLIRKDRPITEILDADYSFLNQRLARHYGIEGVEGRKFRKVPLEGSPRRGLLTQGSFLLITSHPMRTSPVLRGKYVLENLLDTPPPPPPPNVPQLEAAEGHDANASMRQQLEKHREDPSCASCHALMDPIGFGLENFDATGAWRDQENGQPIDSSGALASGESFSGAGELREIILSEHRDDFLRSVASKMLTYSLGRGADWFDKPAIDDIVRRTSEQNCGTRAMIRAVIRSVPFQFRRGDL